MKRLLIKKLPPVLAIQLKRFDYDWERECAIKFNDYFEFPRELDMEPYTVAGVAKLEGDDVNPENQVKDGMMFTQIITLLGVEIRNTFSCVHIDVVVVLISNI